MNRLSHTLLAAGLALAPLVLLPVTAHADDDRLGLSLDGVHFSDAIERPLFAADIRWVPGDVRTATFWVRNQSVDAGDLAVAVSRGPRGPLLGSDALRVEARAGHDAWALVESGRVTGVLDLQDVSSSDSVPVQVRVTMLDAAPDATMLLAADHDLDVRLTDVRARTGAGTSELPGTGSPVPPGLLWLGVSLVGAGAFVLTRRRTVRREVRRG